MRYELLNIIRCPKCFSSLILVEQILDDVEIVTGI